MSVMFTKVHFYEYTMLKLSLGYVEIFVQYNMFTEVLAAENRDFRYMIRIAAAIDQYS